MITGQLSLIPVGGRTCPPWHAKAETPTVVGNTQGRARIPAFRHVRAIEEL